MILPEDTQHKPVLWQSKGSSALLWLKETATQQTSIKKLKSCIKALGRHKTGSNCDWLKMEQI